jgi:hypothetical protein
LGGGYGRASIDGRLECSFKDMLDDHGVNPYTTWEKVIEEGRIVEDDRYTVLPNMKSRKEVWGDWSRDKIQRFKERREKEEGKDPRMPYLAFLQKNGTPKLYGQSLGASIRKSLRCEIPSCQTGPGEMV